MPPPSPDRDATTAAIERLRAELEGLRARCAQLTAENADLQTRLERALAAHADLFAQARHLLDLLAESRREVWHLQARTGT